MAHQYCTLISIVIVAVFIGTTKQCPDDEKRDIKAAYKSGEAVEETAPVTIYKIKSKLRDNGVFNWQDPNLNEREKKELSKLFTVIEIMTASRNRQPANVQNMFSSLRLVERVVKKQLKEGQISESLAAKFKWDKLSPRQRREKPLYSLDKVNNMRKFSINS